jgi:hypothetical protein
VRGDPRRPAEVLREAESVAARIEYSSAALLATELGDAEVVEVAEVRGLSKTYDGLCDALDLTTKINRTGVIPDGGVLMHGDGSGRRIIGRRSRSPCPRSASWSRRPPSASSAGGAATWPSPPEGVRHRSGRPPLTVISRPSVWVRCAFVAELPSVHPDRAVL